MTKKKHLKKYGHTKYHNLILVLPDGISSFGNSYQFDYLSNLSPKKAKYAYKQGWYRKSSYKTCPFCSGEAGYFVAGYDLSGARCYDCGIKSVGGEYQKKWNKRVD